VTTENVDELLSRLQPGWSIWQTADGGVVVQAVYGDVREHFRGQSFAEANRHLASECDEQSFFPRSTFLIPMHRLNRKLSEIDAVLSKLPPAQKEETP